MEKENDEIKEYGSGTLNKNDKHHSIELITIIGEIEGHDNLGSGSKATKYEHILPKLAMIEDAKETQGVLLIIHTMGGDVEAGLAIAEMIASLGKPTVSLVLGGSHSIGVPIAVSTDYSFIVPTGTMVIHPVRMSGTVISSSQTYSYFRQMQNRITGFISSHSDITEERLNELMNETEQLTKDVGSILVGKQAVEEGLINELGGIHKAIQKLYQLIEKKTDTR